MQNVHKKGKGFNKNYSLRDISGCTFYKLYIESTFTNITSPSWSWFCKKS